MMVMDYLDGSEYGIDVVAQNGEVISSVMRKRLHPQIAGMGYERIKGEEERQDLVELH